MFGKGVRCLASRRIKVHLHTARRGPSMLPTQDLCTVRRSAVSAAFHSVCRKLCTCLSTARRQHSLLLSRHPPRFSRSLSVLVTRTRSSFAHITLGTGTTGSCFLLINPPKANGASYTLGGVIRAFRTSGSSRVLLLSCAGHTISRVYGSLTSVHPTISFVHMKDRLSYSRTCHKRLVRGRLTSYAHHTSICRHVHGYHVVMKAITTVSKGPRLFQLGRFSMTVISRTARVLRPRLLNVLYTRNRNSEGTVSGFVLVNSRGRLPTIILRGTRRSTVCSRALLTVKLAGLGSSLFRHLCQGYPTIRHSRSVLYHRKHVRPGITLFTGQTFCNKRLVPMNLPRRARSSRRVSHLTFCPSRPRGTKKSTGVGCSRTHVITNLTTRVCRSRQASFSSSHALKIVAPCHDRVTLVGGRVRTLNVPTLGQVLISAIRHFRNDRQSIVVCSYYVGDCCRLGFISGLARRGKILVSQGLGMTLAHTEGRVFIAKIPGCLGSGPLCRDLLGLVRARKWFTGFYEY